MQSDAVLRVNFTGSEMRRDNVKDFDKVWKLVERERFTGHWTGKRGIVVAVDDDDDDVMLRRMRG